MDNSTVTNGGIVSQDSRERVILFGIEQFAEIMYYNLLNNDKYEVAAFSVDEAYCTIKEFMGLPVVAFENIEETYPPNEYGMFVCVGYTRMNSIRVLKTNEAKAKGYRIMSYIHDTATVLTDELGEGTIIMENVTIGLKCSIGNGNVFWARSHIAHHTSVGDYNFFTISVAVAGNIIIENNCFFGNNCTIRNGVRVRSYTLIGAGAYLDRDTEQYSVHVPSRSVCLKDKNSMNMSI